MHRWQIPLLLLFILPLYSAQSTFYIVPSPDTPCPEQNCSTLSEYLERDDQFSTSDLTLRFFHGNYTLERNISVENIASLSLIGDFSNFPLVTSRIICDETVSLTFNAIGNLYINSLAFISCGNDYSSAVTVTSVLLVLISDSIFQNSKNVYGYGGALNVCFGDSVILSRNRFENSSSFFGGGVYISSSSVKCTGNTFVGNAAAIDGGGISFLCSDGNITENTFVNNSVVAFGGGCSVEDSRIDFSGNSFKSNQAGQNGGGVHLLYSTVKLVENDFSNNTAGETGGGVYMEGCIAEVTGNNFTGNSAILNAGGVSVGSSSEVTFTNNCFLNNRGSGWVVYVQFTSTASFTENVIANNSGNIVYGSSVQNSSVYYVSTTPDASCPGEPCHTLSEYFEQPVQYFTSNITFVFLPGNHSLKNGLLVADITSLFLLGDSTSPRQITSNIVCNSKSSFAFIRITELRISGLALISCADGTNPAFSISSVPLSRITNCIFRNNVNLNESDAGVRGAAVYGESSNLIVTGSVFLNNRALSGGGAFVTNCTVSFTNSTFMANFASTGGAGVYVIQSTVNFNKTEFISNSVGNEGGAIGMFFSRATFAMDTVFRNNTANASFGGAMAVGNSELEFNGDVTFDTNAAQLIGGAILAFGTRMLFNAGVCFEGNTAQYGGAIMAAEESSIMFVNTAVFQNNTAVYGGSIYVTVSNMSFSGLSTIYNNTANYGGGIYASNSNLELKGTVNVTANTAVNGGGLLLTTNSKFYLLPNTAVYLIRNRAGVTGGAIEVVDSAPLVYCLDPTDFTSFNILGECFFQIQTNTNTSVGSSEILANLNTSLHFDSNYASEGGSDVFGGTIDSCTFSHVFYCPEDTCDFKSSGDVFDLISSTAIPNEFVDISSQPLHTCSCTTSGPNCSDSPIIRRVYPGGSLQIPVVALGQRNGSVPAVIQTSASSKIRFRDLEYTQRINNTCANLQFTILTSVEEMQEGVELFAQGPCSQEGRSLVIQIEILSCPHGFVFSSTNQACVCDERLKRFTSTCDVDSATIFRPRNIDFWVGYDSDSQGLILRNQCPFDYCTSDDVYVSVDNSNILCNFNRSGILCGECSSGFSAVFGSSRCLQCTNDRLSLLLAFAFAGIVLVFFLFLLKLTVAAGTIHGLIFYANVVQANSALFFPSGVTNVFIAWLNLDVGIETCFYNGMDMYAKTWLQYVFPVYVWSLVGIIIFVSHFSHRVAAMLGNNPIAVLATLFLLSYAKFFRTIIAALSVAYVEYPHGLRVAVWVNDGNIRYLTGRHIPLFIAAVFSIAFVFLPYTSLLIFGHWIQAKSEWKVFSWVTRPSIKSLLDAYHGPYTSKQRYWTGLLLLLRFGVFIVYSDDSIGLLAISLTAFVIIALLTTRIYKNWLLTLLETSFILNLGVLATATSYIRLAGGSQDAITYTSVAIAFVTFVGIVVCHAAIQIKNTSMWKKVAKQELNVHFFKRIKSRDLLEDDSTDTENALDSTVKPITISSTLVELREPLLEDN